jgi:hypothetical protein
MATSVLAAFASNSTMDRDIIRSLKAEEQHLEELIATGRYPELQKTLLAIRAVVDKLDKGEEPFAAEQAS